MSKKKKKTYCVSEPKKTQRTILVIDQNEFNRKMADHSVNFRTGKHMTEKDRPRKKYKPKDVNYE